MMYIGIFRKSILNIGDRAYVDLRKNNIITERTALRDCQLQNKKLTDTKCHWFCIFVILT